MTLGPGRCNASRTASLAGTGYLDGRPIAATTHFHSEPNIPIAGRVYPPVMTRVLHTADTHIGYRQYHAEERRQDFLEAFEQVIADAIEDDVDAVVHAGDLFHDKRPNLRDLQGVIAVLADLRRHDIPFLGVVGNHERKRDGQWLDLFADLGLATRLSTATTTVDDVALYGLDYATPHQRERTSVSFDDPPDDATATLLVGHGILEGLPHGDWDLEETLAASDVDFDGVLLGDYHERVLERRDGVVVTYPGSTERTSADETDPRGYNLVTIEAGSVSVAHRTLQHRRPFVYVDLDVDGGMDRVRDRLAEYDLTDAVVIVTVEAADESVTPAAIEAAATDDGALVVRVRDRRDDPETAEATGVEFADPDRAVRAALADTQVSQAAAELDDLIRDLGVADSNVRERARERVSALLEADPAALETPADVAPPEPPAAADAEGESTEPGEATESATPADGATDYPTDDEPTAEERQPASASPGDGAGQASMEDYL